MSLTNSESSCPAKSDRRVLTDSRKKLGNENYLRRWLFAGCRMYMSTGSGL